MRINVSMGFYLAQKYSQLFNSNSLGDRKNVRIITKSSEYRDSNNKNNIGFFWRFFKGPENFAELANVRITRVRKRQS